MGKYKTNIELDFKVDGVNKVSSDISAINKQFEKLQQEADRAKKVEIKGTDKASKELSIVNKQLEKLKEELEQAKKIDSLAKIGQDLKVLAKEADKTKKALSGIGDKTKTSFKSIDAAVKSANANVGVFQGGLKSLTAVPITPVTAGIAALGGAIMASYASSEKFRESIERTKTGLTDLASNSGVFRTMGDAVGSIVDSFADVIDNVNILNGTSLKKTMENLNNINKRVGDINKSYAKQIELAIMVGKSEEEIKQIMKSRAEAQLSTAMDNRDELEDIFIEKQKKYNQYDDELKDLIRYRNGTLFDMGKKTEFDTLYTTNAQLEEAIAKATDAKNKAEKEKKEAEEAWKKNQEIIKSASEEYKNIQEKQEQGKRSSEKKDTTFEEKIKQANQYSDAMASINEKLYNDAQVRDMKQIENEKARYNTLISTAQSAYQTILANGGQIADPSIKSIESLLAKIEEWKRALNELEDKPEEPKGLKDWEKELKDMINNTMTLGSTVSNVAFNFAKLGLKDLSIYDKEIERLQKKLDDFNKRKEEEDENSLENRLARLDEEIEYAKEIGDKMSEIALTNKKKELEKEKKNADEEKNIQKEIAMAEYNKQMAEYENNVKSAELEKNKAIADTGLQIAQSIANAAMMPLLPGWATLGPFGVAAAAISATANLTAAIGSISGIASAASNLDSIKSNPPTPPTFAYGTSGYALQANEYAIVGEQGPEIVRQRAGGDLEVISTQRTKEHFNNNGAGNMHINNVNIYVQTMPTRDEIYKAMNEYKQRNSFMYTR